MRKDEMLDAQLRAAYRAPEEPLTLASTIDRRIAQATGGRRVRRRLVLSFAATGLASVVLLAAPVVQAKATLRRISGALDGVVRMRAVRYEVEDGRETPAETISYDQGRCVIRTRRGGHDDLLTNDASYTYDAFLHSYVRKEREDGPFAKRGFRLSDLVSDAEGEGLSQRVEIENVRLDGRPALRARFTNGQLPERYAIYADPQTELPLFVQIEAREGETWRLAQTMRFDYSPKFAAAEMRNVPTDAPVLTAQEADRRFEAAVSATSLAEVPLQKGRLVVRALDVAPDGTVYVAVQTGYRSTNTWRGYATILRDDQGGEYARSEVMPAGSLGGSIPKDGVLELEVFVPTHPLSQPRTLTLLARKFANGKLARQTPGQIGQPGGGYVTKWFDNGSGSRDVEAVDVPLLTRRVSGPTCGAAPSYAARVDPDSFGDDIAAAMTKARFRAHWLKLWGRPAEAVPAYEEAIRLAHEHARRGLGQVSVDYLIQEMNKARSAAGTARP